MSFTRSIYFYSRPLFFINCFLCWQKHFRFSRHTTTYICFFCIVYKYNIHWSKFICTNCFVVARASSARLFIKQPCDQSCTLRLGAATAKIQKICKSRAAATNSTFVYLNYIRLEEMNSIAIKHLKRQRILPFFARSAARL